MSEKDMNPECAERFGNIEKWRDAVEGRLKDGDDHFTEHDKAIVRLETQFAQLTKSMDGLTKAIWGACGTAIVILGGFFIWYIQKG